MTPLLAILGQRNDRAIAAASVVCLLVTESETRDVRNLDPSWFERLAVAAEKGVLERQQPDDIANHILTTDAPEPDADEADAPEVEAVET